MIRLSTTLFFDVMFFGFYGYDCSTTFLFDIIWLFVFLKERNLLGLGVKLLVVLLNVLTDSLLFLVNGLSVKMFMLVVCFEVAEPSMNECFVLFFLNYLVGKPKDPLTLTHLFNLNWSFGVLIEESSLINLVLGIFKVAIVVLSTS
jgi:hypothetical protein